MIMAMISGLFWSVFELPMPTPLSEFVTLLGAAATPCALFAIGASLAEKTTERASIAGWLSFAKLTLHPAMVAFAALIIFDIPTYPAQVMITTAALPVAGNIYILAKHYGVAPQRVSASILVSTLLSVASVSIVMTLVNLLDNF